MVVLGGVLFLMNEVPLYRREDEPVCVPSAADRGVCFLVLQARPAGSAT